MYREAKIKETNPAYDLYYNIISARVGRVSEWVPTHTVAPHTYERNDKSNVDNGRRRRVIYGKKSNIDKHLLSVAKVTHIYTHHNSDCFAVVAGCLFFFFSSCHSCLQRDKRKRIFRVRTASPIFTFVFWKAQLDYCEQTKRVNCQIHHYHRFDPSLTKKSRKKL